MAKELYKITGFAELQNKIKQLPEKVKRGEVLKILGQVATPTVKAAKANAPVSKAAHVGRKNKVIEPGNLQKSIGKIRGKRGSAKVNAVLHVGAKSKKNKNDGYYAHMVVKPGFKGRNRKGSENKFMQRAFEQTKGQVTVDAEKKITKYIQKQIARLSK